MQLLHIQTSTYRHVHVAILAGQLLFDVGKGLGVVTPVHQPAEHAGCEDWQLVAETLHPYLEA